MTFPDPPSFADADDTDALINPFEELAAELRGGGGNGDGADDNAENGINDLSERASGIIDSYRDFIHGREDLEMNFTHDRLPPASGRGGGGLMRGSAEVKDSDFEIGDGPPGSAFGGQDNSPTKRGEPLLRDWNHSPAGAAASRSRCELDLDEIWNADDDDDAQKKNYRYTHPIYHSVKFKRLVVGAIGAAAIVVLIAMATKSSHENSLPDWDEELKEVLEEEGTQSDEDLGNEITEMQAADSMMKEVYADEAAMEAIPPPIDAVTKAPSNAEPKEGVINLDLFCGTCEWEKAPFDCNTRIEYLVDHYNMAEKDAKEITLKDGDCIDPEKDEDLYIQVVAHDVADVAAPKEDAVEITEVINLDLFCGTCEWEKEPFDCNTRIEYLVDHYNMAEKDAKEITLKDGDCIDPEKDEDLYIQVVTHAANDDAAADKKQESKPKPKSQVPDAESITRNVMCCSPSGGFPNKSSSSANSAEQTNLSSGLVASEYAAAESHHPVWYDRTTGWEGTTYLEALEFCSSKVDSTSEGGVETKKQLCPYDVYCPTGPHHMPLGGYRGEGLDGDASLTSRSPIGDYPDGWVQVDRSHHSCIQYTMISDDGSGVNGVASVATAGETGAAAILDEIVEKNAADANGAPAVDTVAATSAAMFANAEHDGLVEETYVPVDSHAKPSSNPGPSAMTEELVAKEDEAGGQQGEVLGASQQPEPSTDTVVDSVDNDVEEQPEEAARQQQEENPEASQQQEPSKETAANPIINNNAQQHAEIDMTSVLHNKFKPLWLSSKEGWTGGSHAEAVEFCASIRGKKLCPYSAICPHGPGGTVMGGRHRLEFDVAGEQYAPIYGDENHWVMIGTTDEGGNKCMTHRQLEGKSPEWGLNSDRKEVKQHIMCCTIE